MMLSSLVDVIFNVLLSKAVKAEEARLEVITYGVFRKEILGWLGWPQPSRSARFKLQCFYTRTELLIDARGHVARLQ